MTNEACLLQSFLFKLNCWVYVRQDFWADIKQIFGLIKVGQMLECRRRIDQR